MARYIDADRLLNEVTGNGGVFVYGIDIIKAFISRITAQPTADVQEVKHGEWLEKEIQGVIDVMTLETTKHFICSVCGKDNKQKVNNYCPNCGAKMDGDVG